jgi:asparagine synthetase B (glutamine-hydrolysing)
MCRINAIFDPAGTLSGKTLLVRQMNDRMIYRGPVGEQVRVEVRSALGRAA